MLPPRPNLFLVGSMKSGTTSLQRYLVTHPEVFMTEDPKEPSYFLTREQLRDVLPGLERRGLWQEEAYLRLFRGAEIYPVIGEASANYARLPRVSGVAERIAGYSPDARILFIARDPVERTISHYWYMVRFFEERRDLLEALLEEPDYTQTSNYAMQLEPWLRLFSGRVKVVTTEALRDCPRATMSEIFEWLGVRADFVPPNLEERSNEAPPTVAQVKGSGMLHRFRHSKAWNTLGPVVPPALRKLGRRFSEKPVERSSVDLAPVKAHLRALHLPQVEALSALLGRPFPEWKSLHG